MAKQTDLQKMTNLLDIQSPHLAFKLSYSVYSLSYTGFDFDN